MDNKDNKRGFSGLSDLTSDISGDNDVTSPEPPSPPPKPSQPTTTPAARKETERKTSGSPQPIETVGSGKSGVSSGGKWILGIIAVIFVIWLANNWEQSTKKTSYNPPPPAQSYNFPQSSPAPVTPPSKSQSAGLQYGKPPVGTNRVLSVPQIRWCVREGIRIETMQDLIDSNYGVEEFNRIVDDYNRRCGSYRYRRGSLKRAQREVETNRSQIVTEAIRDAGKLGRAYQPSYPSVSPGKSTSTAPKGPSPQYTRETQRLLTALGYNPGPVDGLFGRRTADAVKAFQRDAGLSQDGWIDEDLLNSLRRAKTVKGPVETQPTPQRNEVRTTPKPSTPARITSSATAEYFTRGSHQDDVLRVQGTPTSINRYSDHEVWTYGYSTVDISIRTLQVTEWNNISGNLNVRMSPGSNVTSNSYFTRGSHQDDVLRVQGTPTSINRYSDHEVWNYGYSTVDISNRDRRVTEWNNIIGNLKVR